jgi:Zn-dependent protease
MQIAQTVVTIAVSAIPMILAITVHEASHGYAAKHFGDLTAEKQGRITLNPLKHIDPFGTILLPLMTLIFGSVLFGWAKPVPVRFANLRNPKKDMFWVAAAGPASNFVMALFWGVIGGFAAQSSVVDGVKVVSQSSVLSYMSYVGVYINLVLMIFNLIPIPPLDGGRIAVSLLPNHLAIKLARVEKFAVFFMILLFALSYYGVFNKVFSPLINFFQLAILRIFA